MTARRINKLRNTPGAHLKQRDYYEHSIRAGADLHRIGVFIRNNPARRTREQASRLRHAW